MQPSADRVQPGDRWEFDKDVADSFDNMLERSIPQYQVMRDAVTALAIRHVKPGSHVVDLGCSRGEAMASLIEMASAVSDVRFVGVEVSKPMLDLARARFRDQSNVTILDLDLRKDYPTLYPGQSIASVTLCVLTLQFTPIEYRQRILKRIWETTAPGGVLILVEKVIGREVVLDDLFVDIYYEMKRENGYTEDDIRDKRLSLEGVLVPVTADFNVTLLKDAGFGPVDCFWRWMNFAGWIAVKG